ncbi:MAG TPA: LamG-like jellyroll fold domain-containing protein, partial [Verrucomicrobiae bacterium]|nr:LamG-like jellyroll fold domain-containing protein [Verrucomicrobiae bacterium]
MSFAGFANGMRARLLMCAWLGVAASALGQPALQLEIPFNDTGPGASAAASFSTLGSFSLSLLSSNGAPTNFHGTPGSGVSGLGVALDFSATSDFSFRGGDYFGLGPIAKAAASTALNYGAVKSFTASIWFKPNNYVLYQQGTSGPRVFTLGTNGVLELGAANSIGLYFAQGNEVSFNFNGTELDPFDLEGGPNYLLDQWYFYAITYDGVTVTAYQGTDGADGTVGVSEILRGNLPGQMLNLGTATSPGSTLQIGNRAQDQEYSFDGWFNDFRFYASTNVVTSASAAQIEDIRWSVLAPVNLAMTIHSNTNIVTWDNLTGASGYLVYRSMNSTGPYSQIGAVTSPIYRDSPAPSGTWYYEVVAVDGGGDFTTSAVSQPVQNVQTGPGTVLNNLLAANITAISATLNGKVLSVVGSTPAATFYHGPVDGGTNAANWASSVSVGPVAGAFSATVQGLGSNTTYFCTVMGSNDVGTVWASPSVSFVTEASSLPQVSNTPANAVAATYATLNGQVLSVGGSPTSVTLYYGTTDGQTNPANWSFSAPIGPQTGFYAQTVNGLSSN